MNHTTKWLLALALGAVASTAFAGQELKSPFQGGPKDKQQAAQQQQQQQQQQEANQQQQQADQEPDQEQERQRSGDEQPE